MLQPDELDQYVLISQGDDSDRELLWGIINNNWDIFDISELFLFYWTSPVLMEPLNKELEWIVDRGKCGELGNIFSSPKYFNMDHVATKKSPHDYLYIPFNHHVEALKNIQQFLNNHLNQAQWEQLKHRLNSLKYPNRQSE